MCAENTSSFVHAFWLQKITVCQEVSMGLGVLSKLGFPERLPLSRAFPGWVTWRCWHLPEASHRFPAISEWGRAAWWARAYSPVPCSYALKWNSRPGDCCQTVRLPPGSRRLQSLRHSPGLLAGELQSGGRCVQTAPCLKCMQRPCRTLSVFTRGVMSLCLWPHGW